MVQGASAARLKLQQDSRAFARTVLAGAAEYWVKEATPESRFLATRPYYEVLVSNGYLRRLIPRSAGGDSLGLLDDAVVLEELYTVDPSITLTLVATVLGLQPLIVAGTDEQKRRFLAPFLTVEGAPLAAFCSSEPGGSANAASPPPGEGVRTTAGVGGNGWRVNGAKKWVSSATGWQREGADLLCIVARTGSALEPGRGVSVLVTERPAQGLIFERAIDGVGHRGHLTCEFSFQDLPIPADGMLGEEGAGLEIVGRSFLGAAALVGILSTALMRAAFDYALEFARTERRGGLHPIIEHQAVGHALVEAKTRIEAVRSLSLRACEAIDLGHPAAVELANMSKVFCSEMAVDTIASLVRVVGIESYDERCPLADLARDAMAMPIFAGGNLGVRMKALHSILMKEGYDPLPSI
ncbi:acyl-CoA dehydrogenase family protein [Agrobacterium tumefaciens]|nr:acyl-CoA dehydrogenase family protein [Agrobacterium tumefaciens]NSZ03182.1 acyl-CoA dehydrogenase family protein [Agrobacterium tumefaciens]NSZ39797.1 acyl-CoA dehydrogenase family protein [Agrobacterium tumefaciens]NTB26755.1 acyl-CoA dehydrogenase family protein [Agrobacterium tumefaciens]NTB31851.1 acyl-CoA dehydrogenase family protein [Agrobacterium tumefaciens]NTB34296.1 acyl-CoA dehydrogenase family protein [Agrobacterium tumefaciens]